jgi:hypothetical protein
MTSGAPAAPAPAPAPAALLLATSLLSLAGGTGGAGATRAELRAIFREVVESWEFLRRRRFHWKKSTFGVVARDWNNI